MYWRSSSFMSAPVAYVAFEDAGGVGVEFEESLRWTAARALLRFDSLGGGGMLGLCDSLEVPKKMVRLAIPKQFQAASW